MASCWVMVLPLQSLADKEVMVDGTEKAYGAETAVFIETVVFHGQDRPAEKIRDFLEIRRFPVLLVEGGNHLALVAQDPGGQGLLGRARRQAEKGQERPGQEKKSRQQKMRILFLILLRQGYGLHRTAVPAGRGVNPVIQIGKDIVLLFQTAQEFFVDIAGEDLVVEP